MRQRFDAHRKSFVIGNVMVVGRAGDHGNDRCQRRHVLREPGGKLLVTRCRGVGENDGAGLGRGDRAGGIGRRRIDDRERAIDAERLGEVARRLLGNDDEGTLQRHDTTRAESGISP